MTEFDEQECEFSRLLERVPCDDAPCDEHRDRLREEALARFDLAERIRAARPRWKRAFIKGRELMRRPIPRLIAVSAVCTAVASVWLLVPGQQSTAQAFNKLAETIVLAKTARFQMEVSVEGQPKQKFNSYYLAPGKFRNEFPVFGMVTIADWPAGKLEQIMPAMKRVMVMNFKGVEKDKKFQSQFEQLYDLLSKSRDAKESHYQRLGEKEIDGRHVVGFRYDTPAAMVTLWGDPKTGQPVRIESVWSGIPQTEATMTDFQINVELKPSLFDMTPPAGYKVQSIDIDIAKPSEQALIKALKTTAEVGGGQFPDSLDTAGINKMIIGYALRRGKNISDDDIQGLMKESIVMGIGIQFALDLPESADAHYAGKGVKRDAKARPIFWYKPEGATRYRVINADLTVKDTENAPQIAGAQRIEKTGQAAKRPAN